jgi:hypothetical protein
MRIFLSWSGETSRGLAEVLRQWFPSVIQASRPYFSPDDITKGTRWSSEIAQELNDSLLGIICLTPDNLTAPWLMFEAGALSKNIGVAKVIPLLFNVDPADLVGPMTQFQAAKFAKDEVRRVVLAINGELGEQRLAADVVEDVFEMWWPRLDKRVEEVLSNAEPQATAPSRTEKDILEEVLALARSLSRNTPSSESGNLHHPVFDDLLSSAIRLIATLRPPMVSMTAELRDALDSIERPLIYIAERGGLRGRSKRSPISIRAEIEQVFRDARAAADDEAPF